MEKSMPPELSVEDGFAGRAMTGPPHPWPATQGIWDGAPLSMASIGNQMLIRGLPAYAGIVAPNRNSSERPMRASVH